VISRFSWSDAKRVQDAVALLDGKSMIKAGGVDVLDRLKEGLDSPARLVNIRNIRELEGLHEDASGLHIGPLTTLAQLSEDKTVREKYTALADAAGHAATPHIRNMATVGGNLLQRPRCWYFRSDQFHCLKKGGSHCFAQHGENEYHAIFDNHVCAIVHPSAAAIALMALSANLEITGKRGKREMPIEKFFVLPTEDIHRENTLGADELLTAIHIPAPAAGSRSAYMKFGEKESFDWPVAEVAVALQSAAGTVSKASIILGAAAPVPHRAVAAEKALIGQALNEQTARAAAEAAMSGATPLANNGYKVPIFETIIRRTLVAAGAA
jgi:xanthine dehydrogenase YagS FAD-binding subunit